MKRVLVCVLDWGLGHATRTIPVVRELQRQGAEVMLASSNEVGHLLRQEFPNLNYQELPGYRPAYQDTGSMMATMIPQVFRFATTIRKEHREVQALVRELNVDVVLSDNRYGCYSPTVPSVLITHQYHLRLSAGWKVFEPVIHRWQDYYYSKFSRVWVPDQPGSGLTTSFVPTGVPVTYVGWLSRFSGAGAESPDASIVAVVSGPEPQREIFAHLLRQELVASGKRALLVTGQPGVDSREREDDLEVRSHLPSPEMEQALRQAGVVIARSGYSTIMDLIALGKNAILVPTPEQPEQEMLARILREGKIVFCPDQRNFVLDKAMKEMVNFSGLGYFKRQDGLLENAVRQLLV